MPLPRPWLPVLFPSRRGDDAIAAAHGGEFLGGVGVLHGGEQAPGGGVVPGLFALAAPLADELAERLVEQQQGDAVFAAGVTGLLEDAHVAKAGDLIEQEEDSAPHPSVGFIGGVEQGADDDAAEGRGGLQGLQRHLHEDRQPSARQVARAERLRRRRDRHRRRWRASGYPCWRCHRCRRRFPRRGPSTCRQDRGRGGWGVRMDAREQRTHVVFRGDEGAAQMLERLPLRGKGRVPEHIGEQAGDQALAAFAEELGTGRSGRALSPQIQFTTASTLVSASGVAMSIQSSTLNAPPPGSAGSRVTTR